VIAADIALLGNRQHMAIMDLVFPLTALYMGPVAVWAYFSRGRRMSHKQMHMHEAVMTNDFEPRDSWWQVSLSDSHCGAGCVLGDICGEWIVWASGWMIGSTAALGPEYILDLPLAWLFGIFFQYLVIAPLRGQFGELAPLGDAIKSDTLFFNRSTNRVDLEAFSYLYPLSDAALIRKMEGAEITLERLDYVLRAFKDGTLAEQVFCAFLGSLPREDFIPYVADFFLQVEDVKWTLVAGIVNDTMVISVRNLGYSKNAGEFVRRFFSDVGSAGGHRAMAKAVVPMRSFRDKFGDLSADAVTGPAARGRSSSGAASTRR